MGRNKFQLPTAITRAIILQHAVNTLLGELCSSISNMILFETYNSPCNNSTNHEIYCSIKGGAGRDSGEFF